MMNLLYQIKRSPFLSRDLEHMLEVAQEGSHIILVQDAVLAAVSTPDNRGFLNHLLADGVSVHALGEDIRARGLKGIMPEMDIVDYGGWVDLVEEFQPVSF
jgi:sulfur relay protein TusB/DsrH